MSNLDIKQIDVCDMKDFHIGSAEDFDKLTGVTVISSKDGATASVDVRGGGPAT
ncbi:MAG: peptidase S58 family protein, partial [[Eubacterium] sulci]|nr:peptidase S58 family protein [[Eubacterium] sulci]